MSLSHFMIFSLVLCLILSMGYAQFRGYFEGQDSLSPVVEELQVQVEREKMERALADEERLAFQNQVAALLPSVVSDLKKAPYATRQLASVVGHANGDPFQEDRAQDLFREAKKLFVSQAYQEAIDPLQRFIAEYGYRPEVIEAHLLLVECLFQQRERSEGARMVARMMEFFPTNELTGYAMLRLGKSFEEEQRPESALELYERVLKHFPQEGVQATARDFLNKLEL